VCSGGNSEHLADSDIDCNGDCFGDAIVDSCGECSGGNSEHVADSDQDVCGVCFGNNIEASGDVDGDGLSITDIVLMVYHVIDATYSFDSCGLIVGDMNSDSIVNVLDVIVGVETILYGDLAARTADLSKEAPSSLALLQSSNSLGYTADKQGLIGFELVLSHEPDFSIVLNKESFIGDYNTSGNETKIIIVMENGSELFTTTGKFEIMEMTIGTLAGELFNVTVNLIP
ncbi:uncharacterized protein METZ01_LOCUS516871, partial [marine metagenome]